MVEGDGRRQRRVWRVSRSLVVTVPKRLVAAWKLVPGDLLEVSFAPVEVVLRPPDVARAALAKLVDRLRPGLEHLREMEGGD